jgi:hypothetical protein
MLAVSNIGAWRVALHRIASADMGVARQVAELLTGTAHSDTAEVAAWLTATTPLQELLSLAMADDSPSMLAERVLRWCERQTELCVWIDADQGAAVALSFANPRSADMLAEVTWAEPSELPWGTQVAGRRLQTTRYEPLPLRTNTPLLVQVGHTHLMLPIDRRVQLIEPPGLTVGPLHPTRTLSDVRAGTPPPPAPVQLQTFAQIRRLMGRWEVMLECRWDGIPEAEHIEQDQVSIAWECDGQRHLVTVSPSGVMGSGPVRAHVSQHAHAWLCRVVLPDDWCCNSPSLSLTREQVGTTRVETWPTPSTPWHRSTDAIMLDLSHWNGGAASPRE